MGAGEGEGRVAKRGEKDMREKREMAYLPDAFGHRYQPDVHHTDSTDQE